MSAEARRFSKGELAGAVAAALAVGFFLGSMAMEFKRPAAPAESPAQSAQAPQGQEAMPPGLAEQINSLEQATLKTPADQAAWVELGNAYFDAHQARRSIAAYEKAIALGPVSPDVWTDLGIMHREAKEAAKALESFDAALKLDPNHENALYNKGVVQLHDLSDMAGAKATWQRLAKAKPGARTPDGRLVADIVAAMK